MEEALFAAVTALSHDGLVRDHNEDSLVAGAWTLCASTTLTPQTLFFPLNDPVVVAVADGLGGHLAGEQASSLAVRELAAAAATLTNEAAVRDALISCNAEVFSEAASHRDWTGMGTTLAGLVVTAESVIVFNVGDSRVYRFDDDEATQLSVDDNEPPVSGRRSSVLTQAIGGSKETEPIEPHIRTYPLAGPARYLVCTDGLTDAVDDETISDTLREYDGGRAAFKLWQAAIEAGAPDNVTLALVEIATQAGF
jgi:serine/threonine protein phosphatase PrpC